MRSSTARLAGYDLYLARTGYTGEPMAFENLWSIRAAAPAFWHALLEAGQAFGLQPVGLAARDSLRIEAGLPLYGHELAGPAGPQSGRRRFPVLRQAVQALLCRQGSLHGPRAQGARRGSSASDSMRSTPPCPSRGMWWSTARAGWSAP